MTSADGAMIVLTRERRGYRDRIRSYSVIVDSARVARIRHGKTVQIPVSPGRHEVYLTIDWCRSPGIAMNVAPGQTVSMYCAPAGNALQAYDAVAKTDRYLVLRVTG